MANAGGDPGVAVWNNVPGDYVAVLAFPVPDVEACAATLRMYQPFLDQRTDPWRTITVRRLPDGVGFTESGSAGVTWTTVAPYLPGGGLTTGAASGNSFVVGNTGGFQEVDISDIVVTGQENIITLQVEGPPAPGSFVLFASREFGGDFAPKIILA